MEYRRFDIHGTDAATLYTEILYALAVAKTEGNFLVRLVIFPEEGVSGEKLAIATERHIRRLKREKRIDVYVYVSALTSESTEAAYLLNKYPALEGEQGVTPSSAADIYVKL